MKYLNEFQALEDRVEGNAYLLMRRFERFNLRLNLNADVLSIDCHLDEPDKDLEAVFKRFTGQEMAAIQLGKLVAMKERGLNELQQKIYDGLRGYFLGPMILADFMTAEEQSDIERAEEIKEVIHQYMSYSKLLEKVNMSMLLVASIGGRVPFESTKSKNATYEGRPHLVEVPSINDVLYSEKAVKEIDNFISLRLQ